MPVRTQSGSLAPSTGRRGGSPCCRWWVLFSGVLTAQTAPEFFRRRSDAVARYDRAIAAVARAKSLHHGGIDLQFPAEWVAAPTELEYKQARHEISKEGLKRWLEAEVEARAALAALFPWSPDLRPYWDQAFIKEEQFEELMVLLIERRSMPRTRFDERGRRALGE